MQQECISKTKKDMGRKELISWRFEKMLGMAKEINKNQDLVSGLAENNQYLRICGEKFMPVSLADETPLSGYGNGQCTVLNTALGRLKTKPNFVEETTLDRKGERRLQCWLIRQALNNGRSLKKTFLTSLFGFDDILFVLDEVSLGDKNHPPIKRCDLLCVGLKNGQWHPVVIELKSQRIGDELVKQVISYAEELAEHRNELDQLFLEITGKSVVNGEFLKMVIFPEPKTSKLTHNLEETYRLFEEKGICLIEYKATGQGTFSFNSAGCSVGRI